jgi:hypothetical protein
LAAQGVFVSDPLSRDENAALARYVAGIRKQLQEVSELFASRYGSENSLANLASKALVCVTLLEQELIDIKEELSEEQKADDLLQSGIVRINNQVE